jgi:hypothetical protein
MYHHIKRLMYTVNVGSPDPRFGNMLLEQFGGANGELAAAMQYSIQGSIVMIQIAHADGHRNRTVKLLESGVGPSVAPEPGGASGPRRILRVAFDTAEKHQ